MKRHLMIVAVISILCAATRMHSISVHSGMERSFSQRFGAHGYLLFASTRYNNYDEFTKERCCKRRRTKRKKRPHRNIETSPLAPLR